MTMLRRRIMMKEKSILPIGYTQCKYLKNNGIQYINTKVYPSSKTKIYARWSISSVDGSQYIFGSRDTKTNTITIALSGSISGSTFYCVYKGKTTDISSQIQRNNTDIFCGYVDGNGTSALCCLKNENDGTKIESTIISNTETVNDSPLYLFAFNKSNVQKGCKIYESKIWDHGELMFNGIPALDLNGVPCMYDTVSKKPYYNTGTGEFGYELMDGTYVAPI